MTNLIEMLLKFLISQIDTELLKTANSKNRLLYENRKLSQKLHIWI